MGYYVLQFVLEEADRKRVQEIRNYLRLNDVLDRQAGWLPHISINKYTNTNLEELINRIEGVVEKIDSIEVDCNELGNFEKETLFIKLENPEPFAVVKEKFDAALEDFIYEKKYPFYTPHITLCTNDMFEKSEKLAREKFKPFHTKISIISLYDDKLRLIKKWTI